MSNSEIVRLRMQIEHECTASWRALHGLAAGSAQHAVISARMSRVDTCYQRLSELTGDEQAIALVCEVFNNVGERFGSALEAGAGQITLRSGMCPGTRSICKKIELIQEK